MIQTAKNQPVSAGNASSCCGGGQCGAAHPPVPPLNLPAVWKALADELMPEIRGILETGGYIMGPKVAAFEDALQRYTGAKHALGVSSGTDALLLAMMALRLGPGDEVIVPTFTFFGTAGTVSRVGAKPVFCDIDPVTYNIDVRHMESLITPRTKAIVPVHLYGQLADMRPLMEIARKRGIPVIEDACQAIGAREAGTDGKMAGQFGEFGSLSFYPTKNLGAMGDAGALLVNDTPLFETSKLLRTHGENPRYYHRLIGGNFRLDALQAAILTIKLRHLDAWTQRRREIAASYRIRFEAAGLAPKHVGLPAEKHGMHTYHQFVVRVARRDDLCKHLTARGVGWGIYYPLPLHLQDCYTELGYKAGAMPHAERAADEVLALPMYPELTDAQLDSVVAAFAGFYSG
ncbi:MAG: DegT/DnrJ/EryC1/StrS family aminotransferase [Phycisphaerales bacterium]|nr:DegT/DnrJ/EryC1/StrS family aminotransferase [Phycisphaerales bacterium]